MLLSEMLAQTVIRDRQEAIRRDSVESRRRTGRPSGARRGLAVAFALLSRGSASAVRRLDACLADDLVAGLASDGAG